MRSKSFYTTEEVCSIVNQELQLREPECISYHLIRYWKKKGVLTYADTQGKLLNFTVKDLEEIKQVAFLHIKLGVQLSKIQSTSLYFNNLKSLLTNGV